MDSGLSIELGEGSDVMYAKAYAWIQLNLNEILHIGISNSDALHEDFSIERHTLE